jgi:flagellar basal body P-ring formation protein FlgA
MKNLIPTVCRVLVRLGMVWGLAMGAQAQNMVSMASDHELMDTTRRWLLAQSAVGLQASGATPLRMEVTVGALDSRLRLAPCAQVQPYVPTGSRLWGKTRLGLRCVTGESKWQVFLPVTVQAWGQA